MQFQRHTGISKDWGGVALCLMGGLLMGIATAPVNAWLLAWIALIPLWLSVRESRGWKCTLSYALVWGMGFYGVALFWITGIHPMTWLGVPWLGSLAIALGVWIFITLWGCALVSLWALIFSSFPRGRTFSNVLLGTTLWCLLEGLWSTSDLWWTSLSFTQSPGNLAILHLGQLSGPNTITAVLLAVNGLLAEFCWHIFDHKSVKKSILISGLSLILVSHGVGYFLYQQPENLSRSMFKVGIIQGNIPNQIKLYSQGWQQAIAGYTQGYQQLALQGVDIVLTPETALPFLWTEKDQGYLPLTQAIIRSGVPAWVGAFGKRENQLTNSLFTLDKRGEIISQYDKIKLVPLGEYIPFESLFGNIISRLSPLKTQVARGSWNQMIKTPVGQAIVGICYDSAFAEIFRRQTAQGGEFMITVSNDAHYSSAMQWQHHAQDVMRAIECDRTTIRATNTGYSAVVTSQGDTQWISERNTYQIHEAMIERRTTKTLYVQWGDWITPLLVIFSVALGGKSKDQLGS